MATKGIKTFIEPTPIIRNGYEIPLPLKLFFEKSTIKMNEKIFPSYLKHFQEQRIPLSQIILHMKKFAHDLIQHMKSRNKSKPKTEEEKLERLTNRILTGVVIAPLCKY